MQYQAKGKYEKPNLTQAEWDLLNYELEKQIQNSENYIDDATKWLYADEKGVKVFSIYGIGNGTAPTPLWTYGGKQAVKEYAKFKDFMEAYNADNHREALNRWLRSIFAEERRRGLSLYDAARRNADGRNDRLSQKQPRGDQRRDNGDSAQDIGNVTTTQYQARTTTFSDREILEIAAEELEMQEGLTSGEREAVRIINERIDKWRELEEQRRELGTLYRQQQFGADGHTVDRAAAEATLARMKALDRRVSQAENDVLHVENYDVFKSVLKKARKVVEQKQRKYDDDKVERWRDRRNNAAAILSLPLLHLKF